MKLMAGVGFSLIAFTLCSCATYHAKAPAYDKETNLHVVVAKQISGENRVLSDDGITKVLTDYSGWDRNIAAKLNDRFYKMGVNNPLSKRITVSVNSIDCSGHYVANCRVSLDVIANDVHKVIIGDKKHGYPTNTALHHAIDSVVNKVATDHQIIQYLVR